MATSVRDVQVFISVKNLDDDGTPTPDSEIARELHADLQARGLVSFLSLVSLEAMGTAEYKATIDDALDHADVLVAVGTSPENLLSRWVRYEWDSFFNDIISGVKPEAKVFSLVSGIEPARLPRALRQNQTFDYQKGGMEYLGNFLTNALELKRAIEGREEAEELRRKAESEARKALAINDFLIDILRSADSHRGGRGYDTTVLEAVAAAEASIGERFKDQPEVAAVVRHTLGTTYMHLGRYREADDLLRSSLDLCMDLYGENHELTAEKLNEIGRLAHETGEFERAETSFRGALAIYESIEPAAQGARAAALNNLGILLRDMGSLDRAESAFREALAIKRALFGDVHEEVTPTLNNLGLLLHDEHRLAESQRHFEEALAANRKLCAAEHPTIGINLSNLAWVNVDQGLYAEAERRFGESLAIKRKALGEKHPSVAISICGMAAALEGKRRFPEALDAYEQAIAIFRESLPADHWRVPHTRCLHARCLARSGDPVRAREILEENLAVLEAELGIDHPKTQESREALNSI